jgi:hypothetical protein
MEGRTAWEPGDRPQASGLHLQSGLEIDVGYYWAEKKGLAQWYLRY